MATMKCNKCTNEVSENAKFCNKCGSKIESIVASTAVQSESSASGVDDTLSKIGNHLEFLGYSIEKVSSDDRASKAIWLATHQNRWNFVFHEMIDGFILFKGQVRSEKKYTKEMETLMNISNAQLVITKVYVEGEDEKTIIVFEGVYGGAYIKELFTKFMNLFQADQSNLVKSERFNELFVK